jgi:cytochrome c biogenesis protein CcmG, thiol:disulfide interchange protein DsbE
MNRTRIVSLTLALTLLALPVLASAASAPEPPKAPESKFVTMDGKTISLSKFKGKVVLMDFWATWCGPCRMEMPTLQKIHTAMEDRGVVVLGISLDKNPTVLVPPFLKQNGITYTNLADHPKEPSAGKWGVSGIPALFLIDQKGRVVRQWRGVTPEGMLNAAIEELLVAK